MRALIFTWLLLALPTFASAQTGAIVSYEVQVYQGTTATATPFRASGAIAVTATLCNQPLFAGTPPATVVNPTIANWSDPINVNRNCVATLTSFFAGLPTGPYVATVTATDDFGLVSDRSALSNPFSVRGKPAPPAGLQVRP